MKYVKGIFAALLVAGLSVACNQVPQDKVAKASVSDLSSTHEDHLIYSEECITEEEVVNAQKAWGEGIVKIGQIYSDQGDYTEAAKHHIQEFYGYDLGSVLFKPTLAAEVQFRPTLDAALSYFVGGNESYPEDKGFALKPYSKVRWENAGIINNNCRVAIAMGNYYFTPSAGGEEVKVEYTFAYVKDKTGKLRIAAHQSSLPYNN